MEPFALTKYQVLFLFKNAGERLENLDKIHSEMLIYGSYHMRQILIAHDKSTLELDRLVLDSAETRRELISELLKKPNILYKKKFVEDDLTSLLLNIQLPPDLFSEILDFINEMKIEWTENSMRTFIEYVMEFDDYLANWGYLPIVVNLDAEIGTDKELSAYIYTTVKNFDYLEILNLNFEFKF